MRKKAQNYLRAQFPALSVNEGVARGLLFAFVGKMDPTMEEMSELKTAVSEAVTNAIVHGYRDREGIVYISFHRQDDRTVHITVRDHGQGIENIEEARRPLYTSDPGGERGGMGFSIMESFCDTLRVRSRKGKGTTVTMVRKLKG